MLALILNAQDSKQLVWGIILSILISLIALRSHALSRSGALAAFVIGMIIFGIGGISCSVVLLTFFISSSLLSRAFRVRKQAFVEKFSKGSQRDWGQVFANGGLGAFLILFYSINPQANWVWFAFCGAMAAVNADTWATELGVLSPFRPCRITNWEIVETGTSGGISFIGYMAAGAGSFLISVIGYISNPLNGGVIFLWIIFLSGLIGTSVDSLLGDTIQAIYFCPNCKKETEQNPIHRCGAITKRIRGWNWLNNDWVNFICSLVGALAAVTFWYFIR
jgi:uncharacterized protein (TIGR00297 family)